MRVEKIHHINFLVRDIDVATKRYQKLLGIESFIIEEIPGRGVKTARAAIGEQWLVLVEPLDSNGEPGKHLAAHGEGFFLMSFEVENLNGVVGQVKQEGFEMTSEKPRQGLANWAVWDIDPKVTFGSQIQFCEEDRNDID